MKEITHDQYIEHLSEVKLIKKIFKDLTLYLGIIGTISFIYIKEDGYFGEILFFSSIPASFKLINYAAERHIDNYEKKHIIRKKEI